MNEFFYDQEEPPQYLIQTSAQQIIRDPKLFTVNTLQPAKKEEKKDDKKNEPIVMRVSICCSSCVDVMEADFRKVTGIKNADFDIFRKKVTVTGTASLADVVSAARRHFKDAELWD